MFTDFEDRGRQFKEAVRASSGVEVRREAMTEPSDMDTVLLIG